MERVSLPPLAIVESGNFRPGRETAFSVRGGMGRQPKLEMVIEVVLVSINLAPTTITAAAIVTKPKGPLRVARILAVLLGFSLFG